MSPSRAVAEEFTPLYKLTKSRYLSGVSCLKKLWKDTHDLRVADEHDPVADYQKQVGIEVGILGRKEYGDGIIVDAFDPQDVLSHSKHLIETEASPLFESGFLFDDVYVRVDILERCGTNRWKMIEVKAGLDPEPKYLDDLAVQYYVLRGAGLQISQVRLRLLNRDCRYPDLSNLFIEYDVTPDVLERQIGMEARIEEMKQIVDGPEPEALIGEHCQKPYECVHRSGCWQHVPEQSIFQIPNLRWDKKNDLIKFGVLAISELPKDYKISPAQREFVSLTMAGAPVIDTREIQRKLSALQYPLFFLDFETDNAAIPRFDGCSPYEQVPYQYSCHVMQQDGSVSHAGYLHTDLSDPRRSLVLHMLRTLSDTGTILTYNATFEKRVIKALAGWLPDLSNELLRLLDRIWDQLDVFKQDYFHPKFGGSNSIKSVLPAIIPQLSYGSLERVHNGTEAGAVWNRAIRESDETQKEIDLAALWEYCKLDTLAMVELHRHLMEVCEVTS